MRDFRGEVRSPVAHGFVDIAVRIAALVQGAGLLPLAARDEAVGRILVEIRDRAHRRTGAIRAEGDRVAVAMVEALDGAAGLPGLEDDAAVDGRPGADRRIA